MENLKSVGQFMERAKETLPTDVYEYLNGGADDLLTANRNIEAYKHIQLRPRRMVNVSQVNTQVEILGEKWDTPIALAPVGLQGYFHKDGEVATGKAANALGHQMVVSTVSNCSYAEIAEQFDRKPWFQLYPTTNRTVTKKLITNAEDQGCPVLVMVVDVPVLGNRQKHRKHLVEATEGRTVRLGNLEGVKGNESFNDPSVDWGFVKWMRDNCDMKIVLKGIMTAEDAVLAKETGVDGIVVSNHGGRQLESGTGSIEVLGEVCAAIGNSVPVMMDGGIRRSTHVIKALALGAKAVFIGRAFCYGLAVGGEAGVAAVLKIFQEELIRDLQLMGVPNITDLNKNHLRRPLF